MAVGFARINAAMNTHKTYKIVTDRLSRVGLNIGEEIDYYPFKGRIEKGIYFLWIKGTERYIVMRLKANDIVKPLRIGRESFPWSKIQILGEFVRSNAILEAKVIK